MAVNAAENAVNGSDDVADASRKARGANYKTEEDVAIVNGWLITSSDPAVGTNQTSAQFQLKVLYHYLQFASTSYDLFIRFVKRP